MPAECSNNCNGGMRYFLVRTRLAAILLKICCVFLRFSDKKYCMFHCDFCLYGIFLTAPCIPLFCFAKGLWRKSVLCSINNATQTHILQVLQQNGWDSNNLLLWTYNMLICARILMSYYSFHAAEQCKARKYMCCQPLV